MNNDKGHSLEKSNPLRIYFGEGYYETRMRAPLSPFFTDSFDVPRQLEEDGFSLAEVADELVECARVCSSVRRVALGYNGRRYFICVTVEDFTDIPFPAVYNQFSKCRGISLEKSAVQVFEQSAKNSYPLAYASDSYLIFSD
jgi:hypothetical protein